MCKGRDGFRIRLTFFKKEPISDVENGRDQPGNDDRPEDKCLRVGPLVGDRNYGYR